MFEPSADRSMDLRSGVLRAATPRPRSARSFTASPDNARFEVLAMLLLLTLVFAVCLAWYFELAKPVGCQTSPLIFRAGGFAEATMVVRANTRCPAFVHTGEATLDEPMALIEPAHGTLTPRGRTGFYYQPDPQFTGTDYFSILLNGKTTAQSGSMIVRVNVSVH